MSCIYTLYNGEAKKQPTYLIRHLGVTKLRGQRAFHTQKLNRMRGTSSNFSELQNKSNRG